MKLIVGLGNPGLEYERTRHNAGFLVVDRLIARRAPGAPARGRFHASSFDVTVRASEREERALLLKPTTFMNRSGLAVAESVRFYKISMEKDLLVIVDDVALPIGSIRLRPSGGDGGHNGLADISSKLGSDQYPRLRVGVGQSGADRLRDYVLGRFTPEQWEEVQPTLDRAADVAERWAVEGIIPAMNQFNAPQIPKLPHPDHTSERARTHQPGAGSTPAADPTKKEPS